MSLDGFSPEIDIEAFYKLVESLTGTCQQGTFRKEVLVSNVLRRMRATGCESFEEYLERVHADGAENREFLSAITIHTTSWFREAPHFQSLIQWAREKKGTVSVWSAACSTGEEAFTIGLVLEKLRISGEVTDYQIQGTDLDPVCVSTAERGIFSIRQMEQIPKEYHHLVFVGHGEAEGWFTVDKEIRKRVSFRTENLLEQNKTRSKKWDIIFCRNALIYFSKEKIDKILFQFSSSLSENGVLCLGHSEMIEPDKYGLLGSSRAWFKKKTKKREGLLEEEKGRGSRGERRQTKTKRVLIVDDSATVRTRLRGLMTARGWKVYEAKDAVEADKSLTEVAPDLISLDLHMPGKDGVTWLKEKRRDGMRTPVIIVTESEGREAQEVLGALESGAQEYVLKQRLASHPHELGDLCESLVVNHKTQGNANILVTPPVAMRTVGNSLPDYILIGASTGGPEALWKLLSDIPKECPPLLLVQHIHPNFAKAFAQRISEVSGLALGTCKDGEVLKSGHVYLALGDMHIGIKMGRLWVSTESAICGHRPSVDFLFNSAAASKVRTLSILLTGMGRDGAAGLKAVKEAGASVTLGQNEESCVVYGMPKAAFELGAVDAQGDIPSLKAAILELIERSRSEGRKLKAG